jgi:hypothetical protein
MTRALSFIPLALSLAGCVAVQPATTLGQSGPSGTRRAQYGFGVVDLGYDQDYTRSSYVVDPRTQVCLLARKVVGTSEWAVPVSCAKLKATVPEAAEFVTWDTTSGAP